MSFRLRTTRFGGTPTPALPSPTPTPSQLPFGFGSISTQIRPTIRPTSAPPTIRRRATRPTTRVRRVSKAERFVRRPTRVTRPTVTRPIERQFIPFQSEVRQRRVSRAERVVRPLPERVVRPTPERVRRDDIQLATFPDVVGQSARAFLGVPPERIAVRPSRVVERAGVRREVFPQVPAGRRFAPPRPERDQVVLFTPESFREDITRVTTPEGIATTTRTTLPFTLLSFQDAPPSQTAEQKEIQRRRELLGTVTTPRDIGAFAGLAGIIATRPEARITALEEFGAGFASPFVELGETAVDISRGQFEGRVREQPTFLSDLISVGGAQIGGFFGADIAPSETFEAFSVRQAGKTPQRATGELLGEVALTIGTLGIGKAIQVGAKAIPTGIRTVTSIFKVSGKTGIPKFNLSAVKLPVKGKTPSALKKELGTFNKKVDNIDKKFGKLDQQELKINKSRFLTASQKKNRINKIKKKRKKLSSEEKELRRMATDFTGIVKKSAVARAPAERVTGVSVRTPRLTPEGVGLAPRATRFRTTVFGLGRGTGRSNIDDAFSSFTGFGKRPPTRPRAPPRPPAGIPSIGRGGQVTIQVAKVVQKIRNGRVTSSKLKQVSTAITKQQKQLLKQPKTTQVLRQQKQLTKQKTRLKQAQKTIKKRKKKGLSQDVSFEQVFRFPARLKPRLALRTGLAVTPRLATRQGLALIPFQTVRPRLAQRQDIGFLPFAPSRTRQVFEPAVRPIQRQQDDFAAIFRGITRQPDPTARLDVVTTPVTTTTTRTTPRPITTTRRAGLILPFIFGERERRRRERTGRRSRLGRRLFDIADEPFGEVEVGLGFFIEQETGRETIAEAIGTADIGFGEPITRQERQARERLGVNNKGRGRRRSNNVAGLDLDSFFR